MQNICQNKMVISTNNPKLISALESLKADCESNQNNDTGLLSRFAPLTDAQKEIAYVHWGTSYDVPINEIKFKVWHDNTSKDLGFYTELDFPTKYFAPTQFLLTFAKNFFEDISDDQFLVSLFFFNQADDFCGILSYLALSDNDLKANSEAYHNLKNLRQAEPSTYSIFNNLFALDDLYGFEPLDQITDDENDDNSQSDDVDDVDDDSDDSDESF